MATRESFKQRGRQSLLERKYIAKVLQEEGIELRNAHVAAIKTHLQRHTGALESAPEIKVSASGSVGAKLQVTHLKRQRFLDMRRRMPNGRRKRGFPIHNRIIFGHLNDIIRRLMYGFTEDVRAEMERGDQTIEM